MLRAEREARFWKRLVEDSQLRAAEQEGQSTKDRDQHQVYQISQWVAEARHSILRGGGVLEGEREFTAERLRKTLTDHGISPRCAPPRKAIEELSDAEFEALLERCTRKTEQQAI